MVDYIDLSGFGFLNRLGFFPKFIKNYIIFQISNTFVFKANYTINKFTTKLFYLLLI